MVESVTPWKQVHAFDYGQQKIRGKHVISLVRFVPRHLVKQAVQPLPLIRADLFAYLARILAGRGHAGGDGRTIARIEGKDLRHLVGIAAPGQIGRISQRRQNPPPAAVRARGGLIQHQVQIHIQQTGGMLGALQVAAHPVQVVSDAREHVVLHLVQNPGIFAAAALRRIHHQRSAAQRHARQAAGNDGHFVSEQHVGTQVHVPGLQACHR